MKGRFTAPREAIDWQQVRILVRALDRRWRTGGHFEQWNGVWLVAAFFGFMGLVISPVALVTTPFEFARLVYGYTCLLVVLTLFNEAAGLLD